MSMGKVPMKAAVGSRAKRNANLAQGALISTATQRVATTTKQSHTVKLSGDTHQGQVPRGRKGEGQTAIQMYDLELEIIARPSRVS